MKNNRAKGNRAQLKLIKKLESCGHSVCKLEQKGKFVKQVDAFGLFDILAVHPEVKPKLIQVTCNRPHTHDKFLIFKQKFGFYFEVQQWVWYDRKGWVLFRYYANNVKKKYDYRKK